VHLGRYSVGTRPPRARPCLLRKRRSTFIIQPRASPALHAREDCDLAMPGLSGRFKQLVAAALGHVSNTPAVSGVEALTSFPCLTSSLHNRSMAPLMAQLLAMDPQALSLLDELQRKAPHRYFPAPVMDERLSPR